jgi:hypothetical protein
MAAALQSSCMRYLCSLFATAAAKSSRGDHQDDEAAVMIGMTVQHGHDALV